MPLSDNTKSNLKYYRYLHEEKLKWDSAYRELEVDRNIRKFKRLQQDLVQSMNSLIENPKES